MSREEDGDELLVFNEEHFSDPEPEDNNDESPKSESKVTKSDSDLSKSASELQKSDSDISKSASDLSKSELPKSDSELTQSKQRTDPIPTISSFGDRRLKLSTSRGRARRSTPSMNQSKSLSNNSYQTRHSTATISNQRHSPVFRTTNLPSPVLFNSLEGTNQLNGAIFTQRISPVQMVPALQAPRPTTISPPFSRNIGPALQAPRLPERTSPPFYHSNGRTFPNRMSNTQTFPVRNSHSFLHQVGPALQGPRFGQVPQLNQSSYRRQLPLSSNNLRVHSVITLLCLYIN